jgi:hypothetical protein
MSLMETTAPGWYGNEAGQKSSRRRRSVKNYAARSRYISAIANQEKDQPQSSSPAQVI